MSESIIIVYTAANILSLPYKENKKNFHFDFKPGNNKISSKVWDAVQASNKKNMSHYSKYLKVVKPEVPKETKPSGDNTPPEDEVINPSDYNADEAIELIEGCMELEELKEMRNLEESGKDRTTVLAAIDKQVEEVEAFLKKIEDEKKGN